jgi:hypothetical protein
MLTADSRYRYMESKPQISPITINSIIRRDLCIAIPPPPQTAEHPHKHNRAAQCQSVEDSKGFQRSSIFDPDIANQESDGNAHVKIDRARQDQANNQAWAGGLVVVRSEYGEYSLDDT